MAGNTTLDVDQITALLNTGYVRLYTGTQPARPSVAVTTQTLLASPRFGATAFAAAVAGVATANAITSDTAPTASGVANWFRLFKSDGTTAVVDGNIGNQTVTLTAGPALNAVSLTVSALTAPLYAGQDLWFNDGGTLKIASVTVNASVGATAVTVSALAAAISNGASTVQSLLMNSPNVQLGATVAVTALTLTGTGA